MPSWPTYRLWMTSTRSPMQMSSRPSLWLIEGCESSGFAAVLATGSACSSCCRGANFWSDSATCLISASFLRCSSSSLALSLAASSFSRCWRSNSSLAAASSSSINFWAASASCRRARSRTTCSSSTSFWAASASWRAISSAIRWRSASSASACARSFACSSSSSCFLLSSSSSILSSSALRFLSASSEASLGLRSSSSTSCSNFFCCSASSAAFRLRSSSCLMSSPSTTLADSFSSATRFFTAVLTCFFASFMRGAVSTFSTFGAVTSNGPLATDSTPGTLAQTFLTKAAPTFSMPADKFAKFTDAGGTILALMMTEPDSKSKMMCSGSTPSPACAASVFLVSQMKASHISLSAFKAL
mmetsp:Transcript_102684/g.329098  ORF Transcript_102684/g.329098 Transcript_102684/m.329098 type:complete len:359 (+) Transcript_102684:1018-2094(+)